MLVSGPVATSVTVPGAAEICPMRKSTACSSAARPRAAGSLASPRPDSPCTSRASEKGRSSGAGLPAATATSGWPRNSRTASALAVVRSRPTFPATVVTPASSIPGYPQAKAIANASSMPGSQSRMTRRGAPPGGGALMSASRDGLLRLELLQRQGGIGDAGHRLPQGGAEGVGQRRPVGAAAGGNEGDPLDNQLAEREQGHARPP